MWSSNKIERGKGFGRLDARLATDLRLLAHIQDQAQLLSVSIGQDNRVLTLGSLSRCIMNEQLALCLRKVITRTVTPYPSLQYSGI